MKRFLGLIFPLLLLLASCEKDPRYMSPQKYLSQAPWKLVVSQTIIAESGVPVDTTDNYSQLDSCRQELRYVYAENGSYYSEPDSKVCPNQQPLQRQDLGSWRYLPETRQLLIDGAARLTYDVLQLNDSALNLRLTYTIQDSTRMATGTEMLLYVHPQ